VKAREVSAGELLEAAVARVEQRNPTINAVVNRMYDQAKAALAAGLPSGPFTGVPYKGREHSRHDFVTRARSSLSHSLNCPLSLYLALVGQWRHSLNTGKLSATMQIAKRLYALAEEQNDSSLILGAHNVLTVTLYFLGDFATARQYAMRGAQIRRACSFRSESST
jgi:hypothetical protein